MFCCRLFCLIFYSWKCLEYAALWVLANTCVTACRCLQLSSQVLLFSAMQPLNDKSRKELERVLQGFLEKGQVLKLDLKVLADLASIPAHDKRLFCELNCRGHRQPLLTCRFKMCLSDP